MGEQRRSENRRRRRRRKPKRHGRTQRHTPVPQDMSGGSAEESPKESGETYVVVYTYTRYKRAGKR